MLVVMGETDFQAVLSEHQGQTILAQTGIVTTQSYIEPSNGLTITVLTGDVDSQNYINSGGGQIVLVLSGSSLESYTRVSRLSQCLPTGVKIIDRVTPKKSAIDYNKVVTAIEYGCS